MPHIVLHDNNPLYYHLFINTISTYFFFCEEIYYIYTTYNISSKISGHCSQPKLAKLTLATETNIVGSMLTTGFYL